mmetsp:Transcript_45793/g.76452  ORF Transcript_45793/g.76452 Transcript_45793/m.76452 type:complete len:578 (-) Transcript_45793:104-1837(-)
MVQRNASNGLAEAMVQGLRLQVAFKLAKTNRDGMPNKDSLLSSLRAVAQRNERPPEAVNKVVQKVAPQYTAVTPILANPSADQVLKWFNDLKTTVHPLARNTLVAGLAISNLVKLQRIDLAKEVVADVRESYIRSDGGYRMSSALYNPMLSALSLDDGVALVRQMHRDGITMDRDTYHRLLDACHQHIAPVRALKLFQAMLEDGHRPSIGSYNRLLKACASSDTHWTTALQKIQEDANRVFPNGTTFRLMLERASRRSEIDQVLVWMNRVGHTPSAQVASSMVFAMERCHDLSRAFALLNQWTNKSSRLAESYRTLMNAFARTGHLSQCMKAWTELTRWWYQPNRRNMILLFKAVGSQVLSGRINLSLMQLWDRISLSGIVPNRDMYHAMLMTLGKHRLYLDSMIDMFQRMRHGNIAVVRSWTLVVTALCDHRQFDRVLHLLESVTTRDGLSSHDLEELYLVVARVCRTSSDLDVVLRSVERMVRAGVFPGERTSRHLSGMCERLGLEPMANMLTDDLDNSGSDPHAMARAVCNAMVSVSVKRISSLLTLDGSTGLDLSSLFREASSSKTEDTLLIG